MNFSIHLLKSRFISFKKYSLLKYRVSVNKLNLIFVLDKDRSSAFFWWNKLSGSKNDCDSPPKECPSSSQMLFSLINISPPLAIIYESAENDQMFWNKLMQITRKLTEQPIIPSPLSNFSDFIIFLYDHRYEMEIKACDQVIFLLELMLDNITEHFLLWRFPELLSDPVLYINTLYYMNAKHHPIMRNFTTVYGHIDLIFDRFIPQLTINSPVSLIELLVALFVEKIRFVTNLTDIAESLFDKLIPIITSEVCVINNVSLTISAFRAATFIFTLTQGRFSHDHHVDWYNQILDASFSQPIITEIGILFSINNRINGYSKVQLCKAIIEHIKSSNKSISASSSSSTEVQNISSSSSQSLMLDHINPKCLCYLTELVLLTNAKKWLFAIQFFFELGTSNFFLRLVILENLKPLLKNEANVSIRLWVTFYIRRCFQFIALAQMSNKYSKRRETIINFYNSLYMLNVEYINKQLSICYSSLMKSGKINPQGLIIKDDENFDPDFIHEIDRMTKKPINLKQLLTDYNIIEKKIPSHFSSISCRSNASQNFKLQVKPRSINSQGTSPLFRHSKPTITSPNPNANKASQTRNRSSMTQSKSTVFSSAKYYRKK